MELVTLVLGEFLVGDVARALVVAAAVAFGGVRALVSMALG